jgi:biotin synthase
MLLPVPAIVQWLRETDETRIQELYDAADRVRREHVGDAVYFRALIQVSNICFRQCSYCGMRASNQSLQRYRLTRQEILECAALAAAQGCGTVIMRAGEDFGIESEWMADIIRTIKRDMAIAVTLSLGERSDQELERWRQAGADRYILRFETSDPELYARIHPPAPGQSPTHHRIEQLVRLRDMGYEIGSGVMVGIPGQSLRSLARDIELFREFNLDMITVGPYLPHPLTPLGSVETDPVSIPDNQVPNSEAMTYRVIALARMICPEAAIPSTTALSTLNVARGRELELQRGANVIIPNLTPARYRRYYDNYPDIARIQASFEHYFDDLKKRVEAIDRTVGKGPGNRKRGSWAPKE